MKLRLTAYCALVGVFAACGHSRPEKKGPADSGILPRFSGTLKLPPKDLRKKKYNVFYSFNGECSSCVVPLLDFLNRSREGKGPAADSTAYHFFVLGRDTVLVKYYLNRYKMQLSANQYLVTDKERAIEKLNPGILVTDATNVILTDGADNILAVENPFSSQPSMQVYDSIGIFHVK
ncbi:hypothetical protein [Chitinophaga rhizosphaerae]|uniref:hypothetical protein n=1 Tax=Chitinophaga rhizosphaerae TaxID=1864947 RepID=UPI000F803E03|nr:hypothetical protein [Chitinophaga rhizosphaerae]